MRTPIAASSSTPSPTESGADPENCYPTASGGALLTPSEVAEVQARVTPLLGRARRWGFLGPGPVADHVAHSLAFLELLPPAEASSPGSGTFLDLGSGGGVPGLVLALALPHSHWILLDAQRRRTAFLSEAVEQLDLVQRVEVRCERAEDAGRSSLRGALAAVLARGFAGPATTAECAAPLLRVGGALIVAEPPNAPERWSPAVEQFGLAPDEVRVEPFALRRFVQRTPCPDRYPRRNGLPRKRPLF